MDGEEGCKGGWGEGGWLAHPRLILQLLSDYLVLGMHVGGRVRS